MATSTDTGYQTGTGLEDTPEFVALADKYICSMCNQAFRNPVQVPCGHRFCRGCVENLISDKHETIPCPEKEEDCEEISAKQMFPDFSIRRELRNEKVYCTYKENGCNTVMKWNNLDGHLRTCSFAMAGLCPYRQMGCQMTVTKHDFDEHINECGFRPVSCDHCKQNLQYCKLEEHKNSCTNIAVSSLSQCSSSSQKLGSSDSSSHQHSIDTRPESPVATSGGSPHIAQPTQETLPSKEPPTAENLATDEVVQDCDYAQALMERLAGMERRGAAFDSRIAENNVRLQHLENTSYDGTLIWKITDYQRRKQDAQLGRILSLNSGPFYTGPCGYKMCARVYLNGDGDSQGTHLSLYLVIMKGQYDNVLTWPFKQKVKFSLLAQTGENGDEHGRHITGRMVPSNHGNHGNNEGFRQPVDDMNVAMGCPKLCKISEMEKCPYLVGDTIFLKVAVKTKGLDP